MHATFWSMKNDSLERCVREKREGEGEKAKDSVVGEREGERSGEKRTGGATRERRRDRGEEYLRRKGGGEGAVSKRASE